MARNRVRSNRWSPQICCQPTTGGDGDLEPEGGKLAMAVFQSNAFYVASSGLIDDLSRSGFMITDYCKFKVQVGSSVHQILVIESTLRLLMHCSCKRNVHSSCSLPMPVDKTVQRSLWTWKYWVGKQVIHDHVWSWLVLQDLGLIVALVLRSAWSVVCV